MRKISIMFDGSRYIWYWLHPIFSTAKWFKEKGIQINFIENPQLSVIRNKWKPVKFDSNRYDIIFLAFHHKSEFCRWSINERSDFLYELRKVSNKIVWLDASDSAGTCMFDVIPLVDLYLKKQIYKDLSLYQRRIKGGRLYCDFYYNNYNIPLNKRETILEKVVNDKDIEKFDVSWNISLMNNFNKGKLSHIKKTIGINSLREKDFVAPNKTRPFFIFFNGTISKEVDTISYQRKKIIELIQGLNREDCKGITELLPRRDYLNIIKNTLLVPSPFGWGEICNRDFEAFIFGNCLLKPTIDHLVTYPDIYIENETYIELDWDFNNFADVVKLLETNEGIDFLFSVARNGQKKFLECIDIYKPNSTFVDHLADVLKQHCII